MGSLSFDRAANIYDATRALPDHVQARVTDLLAGELRARRLCLEIGVGTGRVALPLIDAGVRLAGIDISAPMLAKLVEKTGGQALLIAMADATKLPFADGSFGAALACHVLHLIPRWQDATAEMVRVVRDGGTVLVDLGGWGKGWWQDLADRFVEEAGIERPRPGAEDPKELDRKMEALGCRLRRLPEISFTRSATVGEMLRRIEDGVYSFTWQADASTRVAAARATRRWALAEMGGLEDVREHELTVAWRAYDLGPYPIGGALDSSSSGPLPTLHPPSR